MRADQTHNGRTSRRPALVRTLVASLTATLLGGCALPSGGAGDHTSPLAQHMRFQRQQAALEQVQHRGGSAAVVLAGRPVDGEVTHRGVRPETARRDAALGVRGGLTSVQRSFSGEAAPDLRNRRRIRVDRRADTVIIFSPARGARAADRRPRRAPARGGFWNVPRRP